MPKAKDTRTIAEQFQAADTRYIYLKAIRITKLYPEKREEVAKAVAEIEEHIHAPFFKAAVKAACVGFRVAPQDLYEKKNRCLNRRRDLSLPRQTAYWMARNEGVVLPNHMVHHFGQNHTSAVHAMQVVENLIQYDKEYRRMIYASVIALKELGYGKSFEEFQKIIAQ
jgi:chromosomal replication initiation ATPase DnaA